MANEIVGDLLAEFPGGLPDRPEQMPLNELCERLNDNHDGRLGKKTSSLVAKMIHSKLPGEFGLSRVRQMLQKGWGLGPVRQDGALLVALGLSSSKSNKHAGRISTTEMYQGVYARHGARDSVLRVVPFNQGSRRDVQDLVRYMEGEGDDESWDLDYVVPFAAMSENGRGLENLDSRSEISHRVMLTNLLRMLGAVARSKRLRGVVTRPATVVLPLSPNHGLLGSDGLYSESKRPLEALLAKWTSESWRNYLSLLGGSSSAGRAAPVSWTTTTWWPRGWRAWASARLARPKWRKTS